MSSFDSSSLVNRSKMSRQGRDRAVWRRGTVVQADRMRYSQSVMLAERAGERLPSGG
jgi:hypothetical protein